MSDSAPVAPSATVDSYDIREMSFQNVVDRILRPSGIKMGGFPVEMFIDLTDAEQQKFMCNICYMIANDCRCCDNKHVFCRSCILAWSMTFGENSQKCPFCRCDQTEYHVDQELDDQLKEKRVRCLADGCSYKAPLRFYLEHSHGRMNHSNADVNFARIQAEHRFLPLPSLAGLEAENVAAGAVDIREQLLQGRMMIHQMMLLMHLEMQLRQQALVSYQEAQEPAQRMQRLDDVMALNEQLNEVGSILGMLLNAPLDRAAAARPAASTEPPSAGQHRTSTIGGRFGAPATDESAPGSSLPRFHLQLLDTETDDDDDDDATADEVTDDSASYAISNVADADNDVFDEDFGQAGSSSGSSSVLNSYNFDGLTPRSSHQARSPAAVRVNESRWSGIIVAPRNGVRHVVTGTVPSWSTSSASSDHSSAMLSRRRNRPSTPRWTTAEQTAVSITVNELHTPAGARSQARTTPSQTVTLPQIQSAADAAAADSRSQTGENRQVTMTERQLTGSGLTSTTPRQLEPVSRNRSSVTSTAAHYNTLVSGTNSQQASSHPTQHVTSGAGGSSATQQLDGSQSSADGTGVSTEPWPVLPISHHVSRSQSPNRPAVAQPAGRHDESQPPSQVHGGSVRNFRTAAAAGPRRAVQEMPNSRPALQLRRSSVRNALGRPAGPSSVPVSRPSAARMVPLPRPSVRAATQQQGFGNRSTAGSRTSTDMLRPRRRSEIAHDIMFPPRKDAEQ